MSFCILLHKIINNFHILLLNNNSLSLSLFEALRGLRDSVASESNNGNDEETHNINGPIQRKNPIDDEMDYDDFLIDQKVIYSAWNEIINSFWSQYVV